MNRRRFLTLMGLGLTLPTLAEERAKSRSFKGWELYSWLNGQDWSYALLPGTNRDKAWNEVQVQALSLEELKSRLKLLAVAEMVSWVHHAQDAPNNRLQLSPDWQAIETLCESCQLQLFIQGRPN